MQKEQLEDDVDFKGLFVPLTTTKAVIFIFLIGFTVYLNALFNGFVWDDMILVVTNGAIRNFGNIINFFLGLTFFSGSETTTTYPYYRPILITTLTFLYSIFGENTFFYHLSQLLIHIINTALLCLLFNRFFKKELSFFLSLIFLVHPVNTESVVYISGLQEPLFLFFGLLSSLLLVRDKVSLTSLLFGGLLFFLSLLSKETGILFLFVIVLYHTIFYSGKITKLNKIKNPIKIFLSMAIGLLFYLIMRFAVAGVFFTEAITPTTKPSLVERIATMPAIFFHYLKIIFFPNNLAISQHWHIEKIDFSGIYIPLFVDFVFLALIIFFGIRIWKKNSENFKKYLFFTGWFLAGVGLHLQIIPLDMTVAERWLYFPLIGLLGLTGILLNYFKENKLFKIFVAKKELLFVLCFVVLTALSIRTMVRNSNWQDRLTLYLHDIQYSHDSYDLRINLGIELFKAGKNDQAKSHLLKSIEFAPKYWVNYQNLAGVYASEGDFISAGKNFKIAMENNPNYDKAYEGFGRVLLVNEKDNGRKAKEFLDKSVKKFPQNGKLWMYLAIANYKLGFTNEAIEAANKAYIFAPSDQTKTIYHNFKNNIPMEFE